MGELLLYLGNECNRSCEFCCIEGTPDGWFAPFDEDAPTSILAHLQPEGRIKLYGGEPTLAADHVVWLVGACRAAGYRGRLTVFSNGIQAERLISILESDPPRDAHPGTDCYLNPHIWEGRGAEPIPAGRRSRLEAWAVTNPGRLWLSHDDLLPVGSGSDPDRDPSANEPRGDVGYMPTELPVLPPAPFGGQCARCYPTVMSTGRIHACAFAAEETSPRYTLGQLGETSPRQLEEARGAFLRWIDDHVEPTARRLGQLPCDVCIRTARRPGVG